MILGLRTALYPAPDLGKARQWYAQVLEREPYFEQPYYVGFNVGGFELGLVPDMEPGSAGMRVLWGVPDLDEELARLRQFGARLHEAPQDVGEGIRTAAVLDPFGNVFGLIENPHFDAKTVR